MKTAKKPKVRPIYFILMIITYLLNYGIHTYGQEKFNISAGFGLPDLLNISARYQLKQDTLQLGLSFGITDYERAISGDFYYHFGGYSKLSTRRPFYLKGGLIVFIQKYEYDKSEWAPFFNMRLGRDFNLSKKVGLNLEAGLCFSPFAGLLMEESRIIPSCGLYVFYRI